MIIDAEFNLRAISSSLLLVVEKSSDLTYKNTFGVIYQYSRKPKIKIITEKGALWNNAVN